VTATRSGKCQARSPIDHIERLLEEAYPNHAYPVKHKLVEVLYPEYCGSPVIT
jgi:hypothetical protein